jgi:hypothetical protein
MAARLYPKLWRERYGREFDALLESVDPVWSDVFDLLRGACAMQMRTWWRYWKLAGAVTCAGVLAAVAASFVVTGPYVSSAVVAVAGGADGAGLPAWRTVLSRTSLAELIQRPALDLYAKEREREPLEDVVEKMKHAIRIERVAEPGARADAETAVRISFSYPEQVKAKGVADALAAKFLERSGEESARVIRAASLPSAPMPPDRLRFAVWGVGLGLACGVMAAFVMAWRTGAAAH